MNKNIKILDCTLRDGLRIVDCQFENEKIASMVLGLQASGVDVIEIGFLRDSNLIQWGGNSTFFTDVTQITPFIPHEKGNVLYTAFIDYGMFTFDTLIEKGKCSIDAIRIGFTRKNFLYEMDKVKECMRLVKEKGYKLFLQGVNSLGYTDTEFLKLIEIANEIKPYAFAIVDTYGAMYVQDMQHFYNLIDYNLNPEIAVDFHSHNNYQLSFALAQEIIKMSGTRTIIIDCTLNGVGKVAGNLNTELIINYLNRKYGYNYNEDLILDLIDDYIFDIGLKHKWGYSIPALLAGEMKSHPNNILYLTQKLRLDTKDIKYILSMIDPETRQRYDYGNIEKLYIEYNSSKKDDTLEIESLKGEFEGGKKVLILGPGSSIIKYKKDIIDFISLNKEMLRISLNYVFDVFPVDYVFFGSNKRYYEFSNERNNKQVIITSNVKSDNKNDIVLNYANLIECDGKNFDSSFIMLLNLLKRLNVTSIYVAGVDGFVKGAKNYYLDKLEYGRNVQGYEEQNIDMGEMLRKFKKQNERIDIQFITPSIFAPIFEY